MVAVCLLNHICSASASLFFFMVHYIFTWDQNLRNKESELELELDLKLKLKYFNRSQQTYTFQSQGSFQMNVGFSKTINKLTVSKTERTPSTGRMVCGDSHWPTQRPQLSSAQSVFWFFFSGVILILSSEELSQSWLMASVYAKRAFCFEKIWVNEISAFILAYFITKNRCFLK